MATSEILANGWDGGMHLTNTSGMLVKISGCGERVKIALV